MASGVSADGLGCCEAIGKVVRLAGCGQAGLCNGHGGTASFSGPMCVAVDREGNVVVADTGNHCIRKITTEGVVTTLAGSGWAGFTDGQGAEASFHSPLGVAVDSDGNVIVADCANHLIRRVAPDGMVSTLAGSEWAGFADGCGSGASFHDPIGVAVDADDNVIVAEGGNDQLRKVTKDGAVTTLAGSGWAGYRDGKGSGASFHNPMGVAIDADGNVVVVDSDNHCLRRVAADGTVTTLAGSGWAGFTDGHGVYASFNFPHDVAVDRDGNVVVADGVADGSATSRLRRVTPEGFVTTLSDSGWTTLADGRGATTSFVGTIGVAVGFNGQVIVADSESNCILTVAAGLNPPLRTASLPALASTYEVDMSRMLDNAAFADVTFVVDGTSIPAHRVILSVRSEYFAAMLTSSFKEGEPGSTIEVQDTTPSAFRSLLRYLYTDTLQFADEDVVHVMQLAHRYDIMRAYNHCSRYCKRHINEDNALRWLLQAHEYHLEHLKVPALAYVARNLRRIRGEQALHTLGQYPDLMREILERV